MKIKVAAGTAGILGLKDVRSDVAPKTAHLMTGGECGFDCAYCCQATGSSLGRERLSRVEWPPFDYDVVLESLRKAREHGFLRVCLQVVGQPDEEVVRIVGDLVRASGLDVSVSLRTSNGLYVDELIDAGANAVGLAIDVINPEKYFKWRGGSLWKYLRFLEDAASLHPGRITTHIIIGLGETEREAVEMMRHLHSHGIKVGLFAFTPIKGTRLEGASPPEIGSFRRIQMARHLIEEGIPHRITFDPEGRVDGFGLDGNVQKEIIEKGALETSGCPGCNRPCYNERAGQRPYNYPMPLTSEEIDAESGEFPWKEG